MVPIFLIILFVGLLIATYRDVLTREVPDTLNYGLIIVGLLGGLILALLQNNLFSFLPHLYGFLIGAALGLGMFYLRQWGGGDAKLIMGVGAILGFSAQNWSLLDFILLLILSGALYGVATTLYLALIKHRKKFIPAFKESLRTKEVHRVRIGLVLSGVIFIIIILFVPIEMKLLLGSILFGLYLLTYSWIFLKVVERNIMVKEYSVGKLTEGDWIAEDVRVGKRLLVSAKTPGITKKQIELLKKSRVKKVMVKEGIPFVPGFLLAFIALMTLQYYGMSLLSLL